MNVLEKILEDIRDNAKLGNMRWESIRIEKVEEIIRSHMSEKEKVSSAEIISRDIGGKPYYEIKYKKVGEDHYTVGYGSYKLDYVINWLNECFEFYGEVKVSVNVAKDTNVPSNDDDYTMFTQNEDGVAEIYCDTYDIIIHCESSEEQKRVGKILEHCKDWIPVEERLPEDLEKVLVWYEYFRYGEYNCMFETYGIGWQLDGHWSGDVSGAKARCIAWKPLPEPYIPPIISKQAQDLRDRESFFMEER